MSHHIQEVHFIGSFPKWELCPQDQKPTYAFIGRSNVGKSSLINMLLNRTSVAHVSKKPGKTQALNYYLIEDSWYIADLPGYGYAVISKKERARWASMIEKFLVFNPNLICAFILLDLRHPLQQVDLDFINWMGERHVPFVIAYTKADKIKEAEVEQNHQVIQKELLKHWESLPQEFISSSNTRLGREAILDFITEQNNIYNSKLENA